MIPSRRRSLPAPFLVGLALLGVASPVAARAAALPSALVGGWDYGSVSLSGSYDPVRNVWRSGLEAGASLDLAAGGRYASTQLVVSRFGACTMRVFTWHRGRAEAGGDRLVLTPEESRVRVDNSCSDGPTERRGTLGPRTNRFAVEGGRLTLADPDDGGSLTFRRR